MVYLQPYPLSVNGFRLDTMAYSIETMSGRRTLPKQRVTAVQIPGRDGVAVEFDDSFEETPFVLKIWVVDTDEDGQIMANKRMQFEKNLDAIMNMIAVSRGRMIELLQTMGDGTVRRADAVLTEAMTPDFFGPNAANMSIGFILPNVWWEDTVTQDFSFANALVPASTNVTTLDNGTAPIDDARYLVTGPVTNPRVIDVSTGQWVQLTRTLAAGNMWLFDAKNRVSRYGAGLTLNSADTAGTDGWIDTSYSGRFKMMTLRPTLTSGVRRVRVQMTGTSGSAATALAIRARRKYA